MAHWISWCLSKDAYYQNDNHNPNVDMSNVFKGAILAQTIQGFTFAVISSWPLGHFINLISNFILYFKETKILIESRIQLQVVSFWKFE